MIFDIDVRFPADSTAWAPLLETLQRLEITRFAGAIVPTELSVSALRRCNEAAELLAQREKGYILSMWGHPACIDQLSRAKMLEIHPSWVNESAEVLAFAAAHKIPVCFRGKLDACISLAKAYPDARFLMGELSYPTCMPREICALTEDCTNVLINLSSPIWSGNYVMHEWITRIPVEKLLFGSAFPAANPAAKISAFRWELRDMKESTCERIFYQNAVQLFEGGDVYGDH